MKIRWLRLNAFTFNAFKNIRANDLLVPTTRPTQQRLRTDMVSRMNTLMPEGEIQHLAQSPDWADKGAFFSVGEDYHLL